MGSAITSTEVNGASQESMKYALLQLRKHLICFRQMVEAYGMPSLHEGLGAFAFEWKYGAPGVSGK